MTYTVTMPDLGQNDERRQDPEVVKVPSETK